MRSRQVAAAFALLFGLWEAYVTALTVMYLPFREFWLAIHVLVVVAALAGAVAVFARMSYWYLAAAMIVAVGWKVPTTIFIAPVIFEGVWRYSWSDWTVFLPILLPLLSLFLLAIADNRGRNLVSLIRNWPHRDAE